jgi:hypothetical protein
LNSDQRMRADRMKRLGEFYGNKIPGYILDAGKTFLKIRTNDENTSAQEAKVTIRDVAVYYARDAKDIYSGCRTLARITGDWRPIDQLAQECLEWFKFVNPDGLRREGLKVGLRPKF